MRHKNGQRRPAARPPAGVLPARSLGALLSRMRPEDLVYGYVVGNYLMGQEPRSVRDLA